MCHGWFACAALVAWGSLTTTLLVTTLVVWIVDLRCAYGWGTLAAWAGTLLLWTIVLAFFLALYA